MVQKEYRQRARGNATVGLIIAYTAILGCTAYLIYLATYSSVIAQNATSDSIGRAMSTGTLVAQMILALLLSIALNATSIASEKDQETFDLLNLTLFKSLDIVLGKFISSTGFLFILVATALPVHALAFTFGGVDLSSLWRIGLIVAGMTFLVSAAGLMFSLISADLRSALGSSFLTLVVLMVITSSFGGLLTSSFNNAPPNVLVYWLGSISLLLNPVWASSDTLGNPLLSQILWAKPWPAFLPGMLEHLWLYGPLAQTTVAAVLLSITTLVYPRYRSSKAGGVA